MAVDNSKITKTTQSVVPNKNEKMDFDLKRVSAFSMSLDKSQPINVGSSFPPYISDFPWLIPATRNES